jgi:asparagine synthase (glutamine-hydrolysing)
MCGIAGVAGKAGALELVRRMTGLLEHRGPDGEGYFTAPGIALGHRRLAILDLSPAGHQPMTSRDGRWTIVLNGEIFNYLELRAQLEVKFRSSSDTEVLLEACAQWGVDRALDAAVGMFAFALWDQEQRTLTMARDRVGEKPLVYYWDGAVLAFASELKALRPFHKAQLDPVSVDAYLALGYVPAPLAIFRHTRKLPAGHLMELQADKLSQRRWWLPERATGAETQGEGTQGVESNEKRHGQLRALVSDAVRLRLRSDVPVALCLSGGVDSSVIAAECARQGARLDTYTVALDGDATDLPWATKVARHLGLRHEVIEARSGDVARQMEETWGCYDEPFADSSALPSLSLAQAIGGRYKVVLTGDGGDEAFAGYRHYEHIAAKQLVKAAAAGAGLCEGQGRVGVYVQSKTTFRLGERAQLLEGRAPGDTLSHLLSSDSYLNHAPADALKQALWSDRHLYLANDLTYKTDMALSAHAVEGRAPFLDHRLLEWTQQLDNRDLVRGREKKIILRDAYRADLPAGVLDRPKQGFGAPVNAWLAGPLRETRRTSLPCPLLDTRSQQHARGQQLWTLLAFACWADHWGASW